MGYILLVAILGAVCYGLWYIGLAAILAFFALGSIPFWIVLVIALIVAWALISNERGDWAIVPIAVFALFVHFIASFDLVDWVKTSWQSVLFYTGVYLVCAVGYAFFRSEERRVGK